MQQAVPVLGQTWQGVVRDDVDVIRRVAPGLSCVFWPDDDGRFRPDPEDVVYVSAESAFGAILHPGHSVSIDALCHEAVTLGGPTVCRLAIPREMNVRSLELTAVPIWDAAVGTYSGVMCRGQEIRGAVSGNNAHHRFGEADYTRAIERHEFVLHYQPIYEMRTGLMVGAEALLRWDHPEFGLVPPMEFVPQTEENGFIVEIGHWVLQEACAQAAMWGRLTPRKLGISVNMSATQVQSGTVIQSVRTALSASGLPPALLTIEMTETKMLDHRDLILSMLGHLRAIGVQVAIDDFGTGYSNLARLRQLRGRVIKIDRSLVAGVDTDPESLELLRAVVTLAKSLDCVTVAEGVEEPGELDQLRMLGLDYSQGFHHARPMPAHEFDDYLVADLERPLH